MEIGDKPLALAPALLAELEAVAAEEHRPAADLLSELVARGLGERRWKIQAEQEFQRARDLGLPHDGQPTTDDYRQVIAEKIAEALASARAGRLIEGDVVFARLYAELDELDRQNGRG